MWVVCRGWLLCMLPFTYGGFRGFVWSRPYPVAYLCTFFRLKICLSIPYTTRVKIYLLEAAGSIRGFKT